MSCCGHSCMLMYHSILVIEHILQYVSQYIVLCICQKLQCIEASCKQGSHASWKVLDFFSRKFQTWKVLENHFGPGKSWKLKLKVLEKISLKVMHFSSGLNGKQAAIA